MTPLVRRPKKPKREWSCYARAAMRQQTSMFSLAPRSCVGVVLSLALGCGASSGAGEAAKGPEAGSSQTSEGESPSLPKELDSADGVLSPEWEAAPGEMRAFSPSVWTIGYADVFPPPEG